MKRGLGLVSVLALVLVWAWELLLGCFLWQGNDRTHVDN